MAKEQKCKFTKMPVKNYGNYVLVRNDRGYIVLEHRFLWEKTNGKIPEGFFIHHKNGNKKDNRITNLECVCPQEHGLIHSEMKSKILRRKWEIEDEKKLNRLINHIQSLERLKRIKI